MIDALRNPMELFGVAGKSALVTGASGALGRVASIALGAAGAKMTLASGNAAALDGVAHEVKEAGGEAQTMSRRPDSPENAQAMVDAAVAAYGGLDLLFVASGLNKTALITEGDVEGWQEVMDANVRGAWLICQAAGKQLVAQGRGGKIVLTSSTRGKLGFHLGYTGYCASKAATDGLVRALACEWGTHGITVNAIGPTVFRSNLTAWLYGDDPKGQAAREGMLTRVPLGRLGEPEDLVGIVLYLLSPASDFCTGQVVYVDGGFTAG